MGLVPQTLRVALLMLSVLAVGWLVGSEGAIAQPFPFNPQNTGGDLVPRASQQFFERGQDRFEREIYLLRTDKLSRTADSLTVDDSTEAENWAPELEKSPATPESQQN